MKNRDSVQRKRVITLVLLTMMTLFISACGKGGENSGSEAGPYRKSLNVANEAAAIRTLQTIFRAQTEYMLTHGEEYGTFDQLVKENYLDQRFAGATPTVEGYVFTIKLTPKSGAQPAAYKVNADPQQGEGTSTANARHLYMDSTSNVTRANATRTASASDPPI